MAKQQRELRTLAPAHLRRVRGGGDFSSTTGAPAAAGFEQHIEIESFSFGVYPTPSRR